MQKSINSLQDLANVADYSFVQTLTPDPQANIEGDDHDPRQVFSGHYVTVKPTPIPNPRYIAHSHSFFEELGLDDSLAQLPEFMAMFTGDLSNVPKPMRKVGWACGYALSIYGTEYYQQCPFKTGNGYGDGRAVSIFEGIFDQQRWEMQLKGGGRTPYCRGADGRAVLRSSVREFLAQEHMHALGIPTSRSLGLYTSTSQTVKRPWFFSGSHSKEPEVMIEEAVAICTRVAPSFIRVGQIELFGRRARKKEHPNALKELEQIVLHLIEREYKDEIDSTLSTPQKILVLAKAFAERLSSLIANWIRVGYCQGNFNSDNCAVGGFTLDYGPFGFIDMFEPKYQPWTGGGEHFSFFNQPLAGARNFHSFCNALAPLLDAEGLEALEVIKSGFAEVMQSKMEQMWSSKLGLEQFDATLLRELMLLMIESSADYTILFRELCAIPTEITPLLKSFYTDSVYDEKRLQRWTNWLEKWRESLNIATPEAKESLSNKMKQSNPKYTLREWILVPAYQKANQGDYTLIRELQEIMTNPYAELSKESEEKYYAQKPSHFFDVAGVSHVSCSS